MAFNLATFKTRALTAVVFVIVMLGGLLWNQWSFLALFTIIHFGCWWEYIKLMRKIYGEKYLPYCLFGLIYITMPVLMMIALAFEIKIYTVNNTNEVIYNQLIPVVIIFSIWINDTMAYIVGSLIGKTPFSKISPKKTWEGTIGGAVLCIIVIGLSGTYIRYGKIIDSYHWYIIAAIAAIFGTMGDLLESKLKRLAGVKDSGSIMPGHGGFLDRFDSLLLATPFVWLYVYLFVR
ncbi:MAG: phosphatidate cytidylyltransferase [Sphingobacteriales bacterium]|nr:MAG: phosphatidate cytidylyltransferase [Sphingobacteriales bacterium]